MPERCATCGSLLGDGGAMRATERECVACYGLDGGGQDDEFEPDRDLARSFDVCPACDGTGERDWLSGAPCYRCHGHGMTDLDPDDPDPPASTPQWARDAIREAFAKTGGSDAG